MSTTLGSGAEFAGYRVMGLLGRGGMGFVYQAEHLLLKRKAALKTLAPGLGGSDFKERFVRESQTVASIDHPNIIPIYDAGDLDGLAYISMRFVNGPDLGQLIEEGGLQDPHEALTILEQVAGALDAAHARGIIHRDVKPPNVMIEEGSGRIYLMDFGIAKQGGEKGMTQAGAFVGTVEYAAPEQIEAKTEITTAADIYAFGGVLYESLTGKKPYERDTDVAVMFAHITEPPPKVSLARPDLPEALDAVIARAMAKAPEERYATCREMIEAARAALGGAARSTPSPNALATEAQPAARPRSSLPVPATPMIGRDDELAAVSALLGQPAVRIVTLTGIGGTGKTRLALEAATTLRDVFEEAYFVDLTSVRDANLVGSAIAGVLGVSESPNKPLLDDHRRAPRRSANADRPRQLRAGAAGGGAGRRAPRRRPRPDVRSPRAGRRFASAASASTRCSRSPCPKPGPTLPTRRRSCSSWNGRGRPSRASSSPRTTSRPSRRSARASRGYRSRSSWRLPASS